MNKGAKRIIVSILVLLAIILSIIAFFSRILVPEFKSTVIETSYGDTFNVSYDSYRDETIIQDNNSRFHLVIKGEVTSEDFIELKNTDSTKVYKVKYTVLFDMGNGFERFNGDLDANSIITTIVKENLLSDYSFFSYNIEYFLNSASYHIEAEHIIQLLCEDNYSQLSQYGLTQAVVSNHNEIDSIKKKALEYKELIKLNQITPSSTSKMPYIE